MTHTGQYTGTISRSACKLSALLNCGQLVHSVFHNESLLAYNASFTPVDVASIYVEEEEVLDFVMRQCLAGLDVKSMNRFPAGQHLNELLCPSGAGVDFSSAVLGADIVNGQLAVPHPWTGPGAYVPRTEIMYLGVWSAVLVLASLVSSIMSVGCLCCAAKPVEVTATAAAGGGVVEDKPHARCHGYTRFVTGVFLATAFALLILNVYFLFTAAALADTSSFCHDVDPAVYNTYEADSNCTTLATGPTIGGVSAECIPTVADRLGYPEAVVAYYAPTPTCVVSPSAGHDDNDEHEEPHNLDRLAAVFGSSVAIWAAGTVTGLIAIVIFIFTAAAFDSTQEVFQGVRVLWTRMSGRGAAPQHASSGPYTAATPLTGAAATAPVGSAPTYK